MSLNVITANRLNDGVVIFLTGTGWSTDLQQAETAEGKEATAALLTRAEAEPGVAVGPYEIAVERIGEELHPLRYRERLRMSGPSVDYLKPQAA
ncbi:MAG: hypothetical protein TEF_19245 [Rhizobiales bacterium NRL2]|jgi:hypothetical protein|nr:MAG: hypothetical protein TEF_19245 [Rhizobiales bacterium NRL2]